MAEPISVAIPITQKVIRPEPTNTDPKTVEIAQWTERDQIGRGAILSALSNTLFDVYCSDSYTAKSLWDELDLKYNTEEQGLEKYSVSKFMRYQMVEDRSMAEQTYEIINLEHALADAEMKLPEKFLVMSIVDKFPKSWENFGMTLKHQKGRLSLDDLMIAISIEEEHRNQMHKMPVEHQPRANLIVGKQKVNKINTNSKAINKSKISKNKKPKANKPCWNCGQVGHWAKLCPNKKAKTGQAVVNMVVGGSSGASTSGATDGYVSVQPELLTIYEPYDWLIDTGANVHVCADKSLFVSYQAISGRTVSMGNSSTAEVLGIGSVDLKFPSGRILSLKRVHHVPTVRRNIISGSVIVREGYELVFKFNKVVIQQFGIFVGKGYLDDGLFKVRVDNNKIDVSDSIILNVESSTLWHSRLGHLNFNSIKRMMNLNLIPSQNIERNHKCQVCVEAKQVRKPYQSIERDSEILDLVHTDICEFNGVLTRDHKRYFITFIDDCSRYCYVFLMKNKDEALDKFILFKNEAETQTGKKLKRLRSDRGREYESSKFNEYCQTFGIIHEETPPYSPSSNGMAERKNRTFKDMINSLLLTRLPKYLWGEALNTACHILNRVPLKHNTSTPFELWKGRKPSLKYFRVWGCLAKVLVPEHKRKKLGPKTVDAVFLGYVETSYALRFLVIKSEIPGIEVNTIVEFRDAVFLEDVFPLKTGIPSNVSLNYSLASTSIPEHVEKMSMWGVNSSSSNQTHEESDEPRRSKRARVVKDFGSDFVTYNIEDDPITFKDAMASSEAKQWKEAVKSEMDSIVSNGTWVLVDLPPGCTTIGCKWIFKRKLKPDGTIDKFKARSVAKGFKQKEGIDYFYTYSPVARLTTIRVLIALASVYNLPIHQMDVKTAFLYGELEEEIYMDQPEGFVAHGNEYKVCKLVKSLYGLKQAPKQWHEKFDKTILAFGFTVNENDKCIYCKVKGDKMIILCLYVDDILLIGSCLDIITETKSFLKNKFEMKDMGEANVILGIKLTRSTDGITISQSHYVEKIIEKFDYQNSRIAKTPYDPSVALFKNESGVPVAQLRYSQIIGSLQYLANGTRPDISFSVSKLARYTILRYLKGSVSLAIHYGRFPAVLEGYSDASWIAKNSGTELCALDTTGTEAEWLFGLLSQLPIVSQPLSPIVVHCDNQTTIAKVRSRKYNQKTKRHIQVRLKSIRALVSNRVIGIDFVGTKDNVADPLTKGLNLSQVHKSRLGMGLKTHEAPNRLILCIWSLSPEILKGAATARIGLFLKAFMNKIRTHGLSVNPKDQHKASGLLLLTYVVTLTGLNSRLSSI
ncbi:UNVERIFIED_CONTAM: Retrovirus-related Pol polyprotein from transposon TNT 1-94 [Sesamum indicum]